MDCGELYAGGPKYMHEQGVFPLGSDSVWLGGFAGLSGVRTVCDLGCGGGALSLMLLGRKPELKVWAADISEKAVELARKNAALNGFKINAVCGDVANYRELFGEKGGLAGRFDLVISNPPYFRAGAGRRAAGPERASAREEGGCTLDELCRAAAFFCRWGGRFALVHRPERLSELCCALTAAGLEPKRLRFVQRRDGAPIVALLEARRGARPGLAVEPPLAAP
jgi:tRNA1Val (adenine37-N6)-methyltransferase